MVPFVVLIILDGWGIAPASPGNAISQANLPNLKTYLSAYPHTTLTASGEAVGLPRGEVGNTETGHLNLGAGRVVYQDLLRINMSISDGSFFKNTTLISAIEHAKKNNSNLHLLGLIGTGGVHSSTEHLFALINLCKQQNFSRVFLHLFTDGRDSPPNMAISYLQKVENVLQTTGVGTIASIMGRFWPLDRDFRWERTQTAYRALTQGEGLLTAEYKTEIEKSYEKGITDEFLEPLIMTKNGTPRAIISENDAVVFFNFRIDRPRQLTRAFVFEDFNTENQQAFDFDPYEIKYRKTHLAPQVSSGGFERGEKIKNMYFATMTQYENTTLGYLRVAFPPTVVNLPLGGVISQNGLRQVRIAESEKERFVTFYFNGQREIPFSGEERKIVPSLKVSTYDQKPEMSASEITTAFLEILGNTNQNKYSLFVLNFANADMIGHTGNLKAAITACEVIDKNLGKIVQSVKSIGGVVIITADHGNTEEMLSIDGKPETEHSANPVPFTIVGEMFLGNGNTLTSGILADVAPTILKLLGIPQPSDMTGRALI
ncbi:MAG: 2,3-bisphosphoglycerate-independent phosphoglycerate mutase [Microgenomates group bacterium Gr01-1014_5]|nr:MAG: 2,3-bisphosphoglycerate-independent phosphoglycerate mutase [Microgenomates group bacterium Gr01-1014_5]